MPDTKWVSKQNLQTFWEYIKDQIEEIVSHAAVGVEATWDEYEELPEEEKLNGTIYYITDKDNEDILFASDATYDNTQSGLTATDVQGAIDEVKGEIDEVAGIANNLPVIGGQELSVTLSNLNCSGSISSTLYVLDHGKYIVIGGRVLFSNYSRTSNNPGVQIALPSNITVVESLNNYIGGLVANTSAATPESIILRTTAGENIVKIYSSETMKNISGGTNFALSITPFMLEVNRT